MRTSPARASGEGQGQRRAIGIGLAIAAVLLVSLNLRPGATSVGPVLVELSDGLGMGPSLAGLLTALPGICFGLIGALAVALARRVGVTAGITLGLAVVAAGLAARAMTDSIPFFLMLSMLALAGMAVGNVLVPAWIKRHGRRPVLLMTVYSSGLTLGGSAGAALTAPVSASAGAGWRAGLGVWSVAALVALVPWVLITAREQGLRPRRRIPSATAAPRIRLASSRTAVGLTMLFAVQAMNAYIQFGWLPQIYRDAGVSATHAGLLVGLLSGLGFVGGLVMPTVIARSATLTPWMLGFGVLMVCGYGGLLLAPAQLPWLWALLLGISGFAFPTAIALITARSREPVVTARLSGFVQPIGYLLAAIGPYAVGLIYEATDGWQVVLPMLMASGVVLTLAGLRVSRPVFVDDEL